MSSGTVPAEESMCFPRIESFVTFPGSRRRFHSPPVISVRDVAWALCNGPFTPIVTKSPVKARDRSLIKSQGRGRGGGYNFLRGLIISVISHDNIFKISDFPFTCSLTLCHLGIIVIIYIWKSIYCQIYGIICPCFVRGLIRLSDDYISH